MIISKEIITEGVVNSISTRSPITDKFTIELIFVSSIDMDVYPMEITTPHQEVVNFFANNKKFKLDFVPIAKSDI